MSDPQVRNTVDMKLEVVVIPVSDVDRAKRFQFTPPGSGCSVIFGRNVTASAPGSAQGLYLIVSDIKAAREQLLAHGVEISDVFHAADGVYVGADEPYLFGRHRVSGPDTEHRTYSRPAHGRHTGERGSRPTRGAICSLPRAGDS